MTVSNSVYDSRGKTIVSTKNFSLVEECVKRTRMACQNWFILPLILILESYDKLL
jgi:hypothetical protein